MDPSRGDSRYNLNYSMSSIGLTLADQNDMYGNPAAVAALGGRPPSTGLLQSISGGGGPSGGLAPRSSGNLMSNVPQCQSLSNSSGSHSTSQQRGIKRAGSDCYDDSHHRSVGNVGGGGISLHGLDNCNSSGNVQHSGQQQQQQQQQPQSSVGVSDVVDDSYNSQQSKKSPPANGKKTKGRVKIKMEYIDNKLRRYTTFSKRKTGIMKKAYELSTLTGTQVMLLVASETGHVYTFATRKLQPMITSEAGKQLIQTCLNSPDPPSAGGGDQRMSATGFEETELSYNIADEDSKEIRSPLSSINDSDDSSDLEGIGVINNYNVNNADTPPVDIHIASETKCNKSNIKNDNHKQEYNKPSIITTESKQYDSHQQSNIITKKALTSIEKSFHPPNDLANVPQGVLLQLIEAGHLQVHTEEDGSGHQYVAIPLHPSTVDLLHSNKLTNNNSFNKSDETADNSTTLINIHKPTQTGVIIKQELGD